MPVCHTAHPGTAVPVGGNGETWPPAGMGSSTGSFLFSSEDIIYSLCESVAWLMHAPALVCAQRQFSVLFLWLFFFFFLSASKVNTTLFVAMIHPVPLLFWCRADGRQVSAVRKGREPL